MRETLVVKDENLEFSVNDTYNGLVCFTMLGDRSNLDGNPGIFLSSGGADTVMSKETFKRVLKMMVRFDEKVSNGV
jgi:hypothetical protein